ncbi:hypothetical protein D5R81_14165 [Parashewanella spongiae]|uniref:Dienelactone hydrolase domain-containing protein n=1 Tax=Parashewanella spongiae TaxID=342950 RepID=A0A3A6TK99_9GAMM|nr:hypothetical protein [Parashewanella spongiae]MCL1078832.1 hypothetical protein [Parashewanella spongiae]RJY10659.1 hypothetical protein D5R81_14165 [Parashewanella spongiae]
MRIFVVSDIWGATEPFKKLCQDIGDNVISIDPYDGVNLSFSDEQQAYQHFIKNVGLEQYTQLVFHQVSQHKQSAGILIGFSIGASAIWNISSMLSEYQIMKAYCFYGGQIRHKTDMLPSIEIELIAPQSEAHFDQNEMLNAIQKIKKVNIQRTPYYHGFMNSLSRNFDKQGYEKYLDLLVRLSHYKMKIAAYFLW